MSVADPPVVWPQPPRSRERAAPVTRPVVARLCVSASTVSGRTGKRQAQRGHPQHAGKQEYKQLGRQQAQRTREHE